MVWYYGDIALQKETNLIAISLLNVLYIYVMHAKYAYYILFN